MTFRSCSVVVALMVLRVLPGCGSGWTQAGEAPVDSADKSRVPPLADSSLGDHRGGYGRTYGEQHYSPLDDINADNVAYLSLARSYDMGGGNPATIPIAANGVLYVSSGLSVVRAFDASGGKLQWEHDTGVGAVAGEKLPPAWGSRGVACWDGKVYTGTLDGRLVALDAKTGDELWSVQTTSPIDGRYIAGARFPDGRDFALWPTDGRARSWMPTAFSPKTGLIYVPEREAGGIYNDRGIDLKNWSRSGQNVPAMGVVFYQGVKHPLQNISELLAWKPVTQEKAWSAKAIGRFNGGVLATAGNLVFQGLTAYHAPTGAELWRFAGQAPVIAAPITYRAKRVTVLVGMGTCPGSGSAHAAG